MGDFGDQLRLIEGINSQLQGINQTLERQIGLQTLVANSMQDGTAEADDFSAGLRQLTGQSSRASRSIIRDQQAITQATGATASATAANQSTMTSGLDNMINKVSEWSGRYRDLYRGIQEFFGGGMRLSGEYYDEMNQQSKNLIESTTYMVEQFSGPQQQLEDMYGKNLGLQAIFEDEAEALSYFEGVLQSSVNTYAAIRDMASADGREQIRDMALLAKGMGYSADQASTFVQRQISLTGEANIEMLEDAATASAAIAAEFGIPQKQISRGLEEIIGSTERFGNVMPEEAARISASLYMMGLDFQDLERSVGQFQSFESAASSVGNLTSVFGLNMDAMEMMMLANEDQEQFLGRMRSSFLEAGVSVDTLNLAQKQLIRDQLGLSSVESVERLLGPLGAATEEIDRMQQAQEGADAEGFEAIRRDVLLLADATEAKSDEVRESLRRAFGAGMVQELVDFDRQIGLTGQQIRQSLGAETFSALGTGAEKLEELLGVSPDSFLGQLGGLIEGLGSAIAGTIKAGFGQIGDIMSSLPAIPGLPGATAGVETGSSSLTSYRDSTLFTLDEVDGRWRVHMDVLDEVAAHPLTALTSPYTKAHGQYLSSILYTTRESEDATRRLAESFADADRGLGSLTESQMTRSLEQAEYLRETANEYIQLRDIGTGGLQQLFGGDAVEAGTAQTRWDEIMQMDSSQQATAVADLVTSRTLERFNRGRGTTPEGRDGIEGGEAGTAGGTARGTAGGDRDPAVTVNLVVDGSTLASALFQPGTNGLLPQIMEGVLREGAGPNGETIQTRNG